MQAHLPCSSEFRRRHGACVQLYFISLFKENSEENL
ncbi:MAG: hypothetical protein K0R29_2745, partial [Pseudobdellovibrio sp.]|nr:hypothetical protein [Pseudobdellovibrio sp.]